MNDMEYIRLIRSQTLVLIAEITSAPKPTYNIDGQSVSWNLYLQRLQEVIDWCDRKTIADEPYEIRSNAN
ncbi:MAG: hypothetical protein FWC50_05310 [Planctomycetaceae bacterium]|nr:hypothetical protein [Planctomycetaceae bacterium]